MIGMLRKRVSILCLNIRDFHAVAFPLAPELVAKLMTKIVGVVAATVKEQRGVLDYFQGDRFCVSFNAVTNLVTHVRRAVSCAVILHTKLKALSDGSLPVDSTCGLSVGQAIVGNVGSEEVKRFGIISPVYSQATKLERQCKKYCGVPILAVATMMDECQGIVKYDHVDVVAFAEGASVASTVSPQSPPIPLDSVRGAAAQRAQKRRIVSCPRVLLSNESEEEWMYELKHEEGAQNHNERFLAWTEGKEVARLVDQRQYTEPPVEGLPTPQELLQGWLNADIDGKTHVSCFL
jgi:class 3 adenylate cyclase